MCYTAFALCTFVYLIFQLTQITRDINICNAEPNLNKQIMATPTIHSLMYSMSVTCLLLSVTYLERGYLYVKWIQNVPLPDRCQFPTGQTDSHQTHKHHHQQKYRRCARVLQPHPLPGYQAEKIHKQAWAHHLCFLAHTTPEQHPGE